MEPGTKSQWNALKDGFEEGTLTEDIIDKSVRRILKLIVESRKMQKYQYGNDPDLETHALVTRQSAAEGMVLLKNDGVLPISKKVNTALLGLYSYDFISGGTGSGDVNEAYSISLEQGLKNVGKELKSNTLAGQGATDTVQINARFEINQKAKNIYVEHKAANEEAFEKPEGMSAMFNPYKPPAIVYTDQQLEEIANQADLGIITIGRNSGEGGDRVEANDFLLSDTEKSLISRASKAFHSLNKKVVVVLNIGGVVETASWKDKVDAILLAWQGGQEGGNSVADILSGQMNPSGKLPMTFPIHLNDHASNANFPLQGQEMSVLDFFISTDKEESEMIKNVDYTNYDEGIYVGYRHFDKAGLDVSYPFGYGLSYSTFDFLDLRASVEGGMVKINFNIENTGEYAGKEVAQVYVSKPNTNIDRPVQELKGFLKTKQLAPGESQSFELIIPVKDLSYWDESTSSWALEKGTYSIRLGASSRDIRQEQLINLSIE